MRTIRCQQTDDLLNWQPPQVEARFEPARVRSATPSGKVCRTLSEAMKKDGRSREEIAAALSVHLGESISRDSLDAWASEAREASNISGYRLISLISVLKSKELLNEFLARTDMVVIDRKYLPLIERQVMEEQKKLIQKMIRQIDYEMRGQK
ncbi:hypothetical protein [Pseudovibrio sp. Tun.PSC04-5.I4]|uniref:hypothetical protein n=1 Tax=Pseudovibrio sp. Tun.PSC04-5.I4 TaxID=1798213 RepID=UPI000884EBAC|nr:hypothetical protein [Pseudovibrio sp. Tun.PSC04-5.I4]SDR40313.1 hypothetical protein SAMN04515695_5415 [Pseudovibrio sp. Tun.PSC04-5.I4]